MITSTDPAAATTQAKASFNATYVWMISAVAAMGGLLFGYDWVVIGGAAKFYEAFFHLKDTAALVAQDAGFWAKVKANAISPTGWAQSCALLGCLAGALVSGALSDRFGRKPLLIAGGGEFRPLLHWHCASAELPGVRGLAHPGRDEHRPGLQHLADVHLGDRPARPPWSAGGH